MERDPAGEALIRPGQNPPTMNRCADESGRRLLGGVLKSFLLKLLDS